MKLRSPIVAILWETWRVTRVEAAWKLGLGLAAALAVVILSAAFAPSDNAAVSQDIRDNGAALALILLVLPHVIGWLSMAKLNGGRPGYPLDLHYTRPVRTAVIVGLPMTYLTAMSSAIYVVSALLLRVTSGYAFPLLPVGAWIAALTLVFVAAAWSTRDRTVQVLLTMVAAIRAFVLAMDRLTAVEIPDTFDWPPRLWPELFDFPRTDYAWIALIGLASFAVTVAMVARQRRGDDLVASQVKAIRAVTTWAPGGGLWDRLVGLFRLPCPTSSAARAQVWLDLKSNGLPVLTIGVALAIVILLVSAVSGRADAAINADPEVSCPIGECFYVRAWPPLFAPLSLLTVLLLGGNAFGIRRGHGRTYVSAFEATHACGTAELAALKLLVKSVCVLAALIAIGVSVWISLPLLGDAVFIQMWNVPLSSQASVIHGAIAALTGYEQLSLVIVAAAGVVIWVAAFAVLGALWTRYSRPMNIAASSLLLAGLTLALVALAERNGIVPPFVFDALFAAARWIFLAAVVFTIVYAAWSGFAERVLTIRYASGAVAMSAAFGAAWLTVLHMAGVPLAGMSAINAVSILSPALLPLMACVLAPWSLSRVRHT